MRDKGRSGHLLYLKYQYSKRASGAETVLEGGQPCTCQLCSVHAVPLPFELRLET